MNVGRILNRAWQITWRHKILWIYGILLALCGAGASSVSPRPGVQYTLSQSDLQLFQRRFPWLPHWPGPLNGLRFWDWQAFAGGVALIAVILLVVAIVRVLVRYTSLGALIQMVDEVEETDDTTFKAGIEHGWRNLLKLFAIDILTSLAGLVLFLVIGLVTVIGLAIAVGPAIALAQAGIARTLAILWAILAGLGIIALSLLLTVAVSAPLTVVREYSYRFGVLQHLSVFDAIGQAYQLLRERPRSSILVWLVMVAISLVLGLLIAPLAMVITMAAAGGTWLTLGRGTGLPILGLVIAAPIVLLVLLLVGLANGIFNVFGSGVWTLTYRELYQTPVKGS
ncbi:MAG: hypothetical protein ACP5G7_05475 [Anaerolineae bacterium]